MIHAPLENTKPIVKDLGNHSTDSNTMTESHFHYFIVGLVFLEYKNVGGEGQVYSKVYLAIPQTHITHIWQGIELLHIILHGGRGWREKDRRE